MSDRRYRVSWLLVSLFYGYCINYGPRSGLLHEWIGVQIVTRRLFVFAAAICFVLYILTMFRLRGKLALSAISLQYLAVLIITLPFGLNPSITLVLVFLTAAQTSLVLKIIPAAIVYLLMGMGVLLRAQYLNPILSNPAPGRAEVEMFALFYCLLGFLLLLALAQRQARLQDSQLLERARESSSKLAEVNMRLQDFANQSEELAVFKERNRMAREIHDTIGHVLTSIATQLEAAEVLIPQQPERAIAMVQKMKERVLTGLEEVRSSVSALRLPLEHDADQPGQRWQHLAETFAEATSVRVKFNMKEKIAYLNPKVDEVIYRIIQEGLTNAYRHGHARIVDILIWSEREHLAMRISDNGYGVAGVKEGFGLTGIRERLAEVGGRLGWRSEVGKGFDLGVDIPLREVYRRGNDQSADCG